MERSTMQNHLVNSSAINGAGLSPGKKVFKVQSGQFAGRIVILMQTSPSEIKLTYADYPYTTWVAPINILNDCADNPFDAVMDDENNMYLAYTLAINNNLVCRKLTFIYGLWAVSDVHTIYDSDNNLNPSIELQQPDKLWVSWTRISSGQYYINAKHSIDRGENWGNGPSSYGYEIASGVSSAWSKVQSMGSYTYLIYTIDGTRLSCRRKHIFLELWEDEEDIATGSGFDDNFDTAISADNRVGVTFDSGTLSFREFDGSKWSGVAVIDESGGDFPQLRYFNNNPYVVYLSEFIDNQRRVLCCRRQGSSFTEPLEMIESSRPFDEAICYSSTFASYQDLTAQAADSVAGDMFYSGTSTLLKMPGDALYLGMQNRFHFLHIILSVPGSGGNISWQYFNGQDWASFEPEGGSFNLEDIEKDYMLWDDMISVPNNWQKNRLNDNYLFWIRAVVTSEFNTGPVGTHVSAVAKVGAFILMEC